jgi:myo-inositol-1(or 4)-monophosphatase
VLDPIDGTRNYITRSGPWSVCLALEEGRPHETAVTTVAVVHDPTVGETFSAARGQGAWLNGRPVCGSDVTALDQALLALTFNPSPRTRRRIGALLPSLLAAVGDIRRYPAALQLAYLAAVRVDVGLLMDTKPWDVAAGHLMAAEAGVQLSGPGGAPTPALTLSAAPGVRDEFERMICKLLSGAEIG